MSEKENLGKYFIAGIVAAIIIFFLITLTNKEGNQSGINNNEYTWSAQIDSQFVKDCYAKYKPQVKDDPQLAENTKKFCRCMLDKIKNKYSEEEMNKVTDDDIKKWDAECRNQILNPNNFFSK